ncbi:MAG: AI-2E family transporter [Clostridia bacterium]|nr:AI-2E family transporter [Clostridia bacterium]
MKFSEFKRYFQIFVLAVAVIAVYKTFDNLGGIFSAVGSFLSLLSPIVFAFGIAFLLYPLCVKCEKLILNRFPEFFKKRARLVSVLCVYIFVFLILGGIIYMMLPALVASITDFIKMIPQFIENAVKMLNKSQYINIDLSKIDEFIDFQKFLQESGWLDMGIYTSKIVSISTDFINIILSIITSVYILLDRKSLADVCRTIGRLFPGKGKDRYRFLKKYGKKAIDFSYKYMYCVLLDALIVFVLSLVILLIMRVEHAVVLSLMIGIFNVVPYFGAILAGIIAVLITIMTANLSTAIILGVAIFILQQIDCNIIQPHLVKESLDVKPFWVLVGILIGGGIFGIWGIILAVPVMAVLKTIIFDYVEYKSESKDEALKFDSR